MPWMNISCGKCGHVAGFEAWTSAPVSGELPRGHFQCPKCRYAFERKEVEPGEVFESGGQRMYIPGKIGLVPVASVL